jgi:hypothetical protein
MNAIDTLTAGDINDGIDMIQDMLGNAGTYEDAERVWDNMRQAGLITHDGQQFIIPMVDFIEWINA